MNYDILLLSYLFIHGFIETVLHVLGTIIRMFSMLFHHFKLIEHFKINPFKSKEDIFFKILCFL